MEEIFRQLKAIVKKMDGPGIREAEVRTAWRRVAGKNLSDHTAVIALDADAVLSIAVANETWRRQLVKMSPQIVYGLNADLGPGSVKRVEFCIDEAKVNAENPGPKNNDEGKKAAELAQREITPELAEAATSIADENLREKFLAAAGESLLRKKRMEKEN